MNIGQRLHGNKSTNLKEILNSKEMNRTATTHFWVDDLNKYASSFNCFTNHTRNMNRSTFNDTVTTSLFKTNE
jgi:hypothetical protein